MLVDKYLPALRKRRNAGLVASLLLVAVAFALRALTPINLAFATFYPAVLLSTFVGGRWVGMLASFFSMMLAWYFFLPPVNSFDLSLQTIINLGSFLAVSLILVFTGDALATALERSERSRVRHEEVLREMAHRLKNQYAVLAAVARGVSKDADNLQDFDLLFAEKMRGLASSHDLLVSGQWQGASLEEVVHAHLKPFCERRQYRIDGPRILLDPATVQYLGMALHELCTNAVKHGSFKDVSGSVSITWSVSDEKLHFMWAERSGPRTRLSTNSGGEVQGFGSKVLNVIVPAAVNGEATLEYLPVGLQWSLTMPATRQGMPLTQEKNQRPEDQKLSANHRPIRRT